MTDIYTTIANIIGMAAQEIGVIDNDRTIFKATIYIHERIIDTDGRDVMRARLNIIKCFNRVKAMEYLAKLSSSLCDINIDHRLKFSCDAVIHIPYSSELNTDHDTAHVSRCIVDSIAYNYELDVQNNSKR